MSLYELNKDMLIKLICTIQEDLDKIIDLMKDDNNFIQKCKIVECKSFVIIKNNKDINLVRCKDFKICDICKNYYCDKHINDHLRSFKVVDGKNIFTLEEYEEKCTKWKR
jgi:hypothetical protein